MRVDSIEREDLMPGDILLCPPVSLPTGWIGQAIVALTKGRVSHAALYYGEREGKMQVAHSDLKGIRFQPIDEFLEESPGCYVLKLSKGDDGENIGLNPILEAAEKYISEGIKYPVTNFIFLGLLLLTNRRDIKKLQNKAFYLFVVETYLALMKVLNKEFFSKDSMTCSQYVTQCFTDAGEEFNISFKEHFIWVDGLQSANGEVSLLDLLEPNDTLEADLSDIVANNKSLFSMEEITTQFVKWANDEDDENSDKISVNRHLLEEVGKYLLRALCEIITGETPKNVRQATDILSKLDKKNYFVLPDDLLLHTENLKNVGYVIGYP